MCVDGKRLNACARKTKHTKVSYCCWNFISYFNDLIFVFVNITGISNDYLLRSRLNNLIVVTSNNVTKCVSGFVSILE